ncbi:hypothetical protein NUW58_g5354 [Xylaria curta]|uniref:Uncharacterized protein n=1 Tax=Xylaria curta TaxID=42375 RepID=A0ACC1P350_9PEZI|nr:hypothetical protein NUW58_g5354 [Xylaria curta]
MRLINTTTLEIHESPGDSTVDYAILSHTWNEEECTFQDMSRPNAAIRKRKGYVKIESCCKQAVKDGLSWAWVDTCCIDKTSTAELSEAINSMFRWYRNAKICYAYLSDVTDEDDLDSSRWFSRGWTLQELIAPKNIMFYSSNWTVLGSKSELENWLQEITGIDALVLSTGNFSQVCVAKRMAWAANRDTTRVEDRAYSLMGIFDVNMPLIYGEGEKAFLRLQQEIMRVSDDQSLFAWGAPSLFSDIHGFRFSRIPQMRGLFANSPAEFHTDHDILQVSSREDGPPPVIHGNAVRAQYPVCAKGDFEFIVLACTIRSRAQACIAIPVKSWSGSLYARCGQLVIIFPEHWANAQPKVLVVKEPPAATISSAPSSFQIVRVPNKTRTSKEDPFVLTEVYCLPHTTYNSTKHSIAFSPNHPGLQAALFFTSSAAHDRKRRSVRGMFPIRCFAIVLGYSEFAWTVFIPILRDAYADTEFHAVLRASADMATYCMTKSQLKDKLERGNLDVVLPMARSSDQLLAVWLEKQRRVNLEISIELRREHINLVDKAIFVSIDIYEVTVNWTTSRLLFEPSDDQDLNEELTEERRANYTPNWLTIGELEWFIDLVPWEHKV